MILSNEELTQYYFKQKRNAKNCEICEKQFSKLNRRQHLCKRCFQQVCSKCASQKTQQYIVQGKKEKKHRTCKMCIEDLKSIKLQIQDQQIQFNHNSKYALNWLQVLGCTDLDSLEKNYQYYLQDQDITQKKQYIQFTKISQTLIAESFNNLNYTIIEMYHNSLKQITQQQAQISVSNVVSALLLKHDNFEISINLVIQVIFFLILSSESVAFHILSEFHSNFFPQNETKTDNNHYNLQNLTQKLSQIYPIIHKQQIKPQKLTLLQMTNIIQEDSHNLNIEDNLISHNINIFDVLTSISIINACILESRPSLIMENFIISLFYTLNNINNNVDSNQNGEKQQIIKLLILKYHKWDDETLKILATIQPFNSNNFEQLQPVKIQNYQRSQSTISEIQSQINYPQQQNKKNNFLQINNNQHTLSVIQTNKTDISYSQYAESEDSELSDIESQKQSLSFQKNAKQTQNLNTNSNKSKNSNENIINNNIINTQFNEQIEKQPEKQNQNNINNNQLLSELRTQSQTHSNSNQTQQHSSNKEEDQSPLDNKNIKININDNATNINQQDNDNNNNNNSIENYKNNQQNNNYNQKTESLNDRRQINFSNITIDNKRSKSENDDLLQNGNDQNKTIPQIVLIPEVEQQFEESGIKCQKSFTQKEQKQQKIDQLKFQQNINMSYQNNLNSLHQSLDQSQEQNIKTIYIEVCKKCQKQQDEKIDILNKKDISFQDIQKNQREIIKTQRENIEQLKENNQSLNEKLKETQLQIKALQNAIQAISNSKDLEIKSLNQSFNNYVSQQKSLNEYNTWKQKKQNDKVFIGLNTQTQQQFQQNINNILDNLKKIQENMNINIKDNPILMYCNTINKEIIQCINQIKQNLHKTEKNKFLDDINLNQSQNQECQIF